MRRLRDFRQWLRREFNASNTDPIDAPQSASEQAAMLEEAERMAGK